VRCPLSGLLTGSFCGTALKNGGGVAGKKELVNEGAYRDEFFAG